MLLAIDVGNSKVHCGLFKGEKLCKQWSFDTKDIKEKGINSPILSGRRHLYEGAIICSVVPAVISVLRKKLRIPSLVVSNKIDLGLKIKYKYPGKVGADRIANAVAAKFLYGVPSLVVDFGTAITIDVISKKGDYLGGVIMPGLDIIRKGLYEKTALLPLAKIKKPRKVLGSVTEDAIQSGLYFGIRGMIRQLILDIKKELHLSNKTVIINTGGYSDTWGKGIGKIDKFLTLKGLRVIYERNRTKIAKC